jgi:hypothetical protein
MKKERRKFSPAFEDEVALEANRLIHEFVVCYNQIGDLLHWENKAH